MVQLFFDAKGYSINNARHFIIEIRNRGVCMSIQFPGDHYEL